MINILDRDYSGKMGFTEFKELLGALNRLVIIVDEGLFHVFSELESLWVSYMHRQYSQR